MTAGPLEMQAGRGLDATGWAVVALTVAALAVRLPGALEWWFNADEAIYHRVATADFAEARRLVEVNAHPPLFYLLLRAIAQASDAPLALRLPALLGGVALVPLCALLARRAFGRIAALLAALWIALAPAAVMLSQVARPYMLQAALLAAAGLALVAWLDARRPRALATYSLALGLALLVHYSTFVLLGAAGLALAVAAARGRFDRRELLQLLRAHAPLGVLAMLLYAVHIAPSMTGSEMQAEARRGWLAPHFVGDLGDLGRVTLGTFELAFPERGAFALALALLGLLAAWRGGRTLAWVGPLALYGCALALAALGLYPLGESRHSTHLLPFVVVLAAGGAAFLATRTRWPARIAAAALCLHVTAGDVLGLIHLQRTGGPGNLVPEGVVGRGDVRRVAAFWRKGLPARAVVVTDAQTLQLLAAMLREPFPPPEPLLGAPLLRTELGGRELLFVRAPDDTGRAGPWILDWQREALGEPAHLALALEAVAADPRLAADATAGGLWLAQGGWRSHLYPTWPESRLPQQLCSQIVGGAGLGLFRLYRPTYRAYLAGG